MKHLRASLQSGNWRALVACFLYFDTGFTVWVLFGPLAPFISKSLALTPADQGFLVAVPALSAAFLRIALGNLFQAASGRTIALWGVLLSSITPFVLALPITPSFGLLLVLGVFLGMGGASFAVALPMAGSNYPARIQGLVLGLAAAGNVGAVLDGFLFPGLAQSFGWQRATVAALPLLCIAAIALWFWAADQSKKHGSVGHGVMGLVLTLGGLMALVGAAHAGWFGSGKAGLLILPLFGAALSIGMLPPVYRIVLADRDTWILMLVYSVTFGGFVGMSAYVALLLTTLYGMSKIDAGLCMAILAFTGALVRPIGGLIADRFTGVRVLLVLLLAIAALDAAFALLMPTLAVGLALLFGLYFCFGLGNGATFQLVPQRRPTQTGIMTGIIGAAGGVGGFYLPVIMGLARESTGSYRVGFLVFAVLAGSAFVAVALLRRQWLSWSAPQTRATEAEGAVPLLSPSATALS